jgi:hypothetical protein
MHTTACYLIKKCKQHQALMRNKIDLHIYVIWNVCLLQHLPQFIDRSTTETVGGPTKKYTPRESFQKMERLCRSNQMPKLGSGMMLRANTLDHLSFGHYHPVSIPNSLYIGGGEGSERIIYSCKHLIQGPIHMRRLRACATSLPNCASEECRH